MKASGRKRRERGRPQKHSDRSIIGLFTLMGAEGMTLKQAAAKRGIPYATVKQRISDCPRLSALHARAREEFGDEWVHRMMAIARKEKDVNRARLLCDNIKWYAARVLPKQYGDSQRLEMTGKDGRDLEPVNILESARTIIFALELADRQRKAAQPPQKALTFLPPSGGTP